MEKLLINNHIKCLTSFCDNMKKICVYCHGFGESKERIIQHYEILNSHNVGIMSFDLPCHGEDLTKYSDITIKKCLDYINEVLKYIKEKYKDINVILIGSSFGGYLTLCYINDYKEKFDKVFLKYPAVNFYECTKRKLKIDDSYFDNHKYFCLPSGYRIYKEFYFDSKKHDIMIDFDKCNNDIYIIHGNADKTVLIDDILYFVNKNAIKLKIVDGATHSMKDYLSLVNDEIISFLGGNNEDI